jgi:hypothetical protein
LAIGRGLRDTGVVGLWHSAAMVQNETRGETMLKNTVRGVLGLVLTAAATWLAAYIVEQIFGPDEEQA